ncbi:MAG: helix-turn-helix domain-containing protein [Ktedonobacteraceae bacterium]
MAQLPDGGEKMLTVEQIAEEMNVDKKTVRKWINQGELKAINIGRLRPEYRISRRNLDLFKQERETGR